MLSKNTPARLKGTACTAAASAPVAATDARTHACTLRTRADKCHRALHLIPSTHCSGTDGTRRVLPFWKRGEGDRAKLRYTYLPQRSKVFLQEKA